MNIKALEDAVRAWVVSASGISATSVFFAAQDVPSPSPAPYVTISLGFPTRVGLDEVRRDYDSTAEAGQEIVYTARGPRELVVTVECFTPNTTETNAQATGRQILSSIDAALSLPPIRETLNAAGMGVLRRGAPRWQPGIVRAGWEGRAWLEVVFCVIETAQARTGYIQTVAISGTVDGSSTGTTTINLDED